jgi:ABC-2 type transport system ATP-binding protein
MTAMTDETRSILFSSHHTQDVEQISDQITFIDRGGIIDSSDKETFLERWRRLQLELPSGVQLPTLPGVVTVSRDGRLASLTTNAFDSALPAAIQQAGVQVLEIQRMTLEEIFVSEVMSSREEHAA